MVLNPLTTAILKSIVIGAGAELVKTGGQYLFNMVKNISKHTVTESLVTMSRPLQVEPMCIVDTNLRTNEVLPDIQQTILNLFAGFYVQSVTLSMIGKEVEVMDKVGKFGTKTGVLDEKSLNKEVLTQAKSIFSKAVTDIKDIKDVQEVLTPEEVISKEDFTQSTFNQISRSLDKANYNPFTGETHSVSVESDAPVDITTALKEIKDDNRPSIGKIVGIVIRDKDESGKTVEIMVPIAIRLMNGFLRNDAISELFVLKDFSKVDRTLL